MSKKEQRILPELRAKSHEELVDELLKLRKEQFALRLQKATGQQPKPNQFGKARRNIARVKTLQAERARAAAAKPASVEK